MNATTLQIGSNQVCRLAEITQRQLQWWDERNVVSPAIEGHKRVYNTDEALKIAVIAELRRKEISLQRIRRFLRSLKYEMPKRLARSSELYLLTDGNHVWFLGSAHGVVELMGTLERGAVLVDVSAMARKVAALSEGKAA